MSSKMYQEILEQPEVLRQVLNNFTNISQVLKSKLKNKTRLFLTGTGASLNACYGSIHPFIKLMGMYPIIFPAAETQVYLPLIDKNSFVIVLSQSGESYETKQLCSILKENDIPFCGITNEPESTLGRSATVLIDLKVGTEVSSATKTHTASLLYLYLISLFGGNKKEKLNDIVEAVQNILDTSGKKIDKIAEALHKETLMYVLSDNLNYSTARQGSLLLKEKVHICAEGMTISEFRYGAVEVVKEGMAALLISTEEGYREEFEKHASFLSDLKMNLFLISDTNFRNVPEENTFLIPRTCNELFSPLLATVPLQLLSEKMAIINGYNVDGFVYLSKIVKTY